MVPPGRVEIPSKKKPIQPAKISRSQSHQTVQNRPFLLPACFLHSACLPARPVPAQSRTVTVDSRVRGVRGGMSQHSHPRNDHDTNTITVHSIALSFPSRYNYTTRIHQREQNEETENSQQGNGGGVAFSSALENDSSFSFSFSFLQTRADTCDRQIASGADCQVRHPYEMRCFARGHPQGSVGAELRRLYTVESAKLSVSRIEKV